MQQNEIDQYIYENAVEFIDKLDRLVEIWGKYNVSCDIGDSDTLASKFAPLTTAMRPQLMQIIKTDKPRMRSAISAMAQIADKLSENMIDSIAAKRPVDEHLRLLLDLSIGLRIAVSKPGRNTIEQICQKAHAAGINDLEESYARLIKETPYTLSDMTQHFVPRGK